MAFSILGTGSAVPAKVVTNADLSVFLDTNDEWISTRTGISERRVLTAESLTDLAAAAAERALAAANVHAAELDFILWTTLRGDQLFPSLSSRASGRSGASCPALDVNAACSGFLFALDVARAYFAAGLAKRMLIVCAEAMSRLVDWTDRSTAVLFGDAAGAVVLGPGEGPLALRLTTMCNEEWLVADVPSGNSPFAPYSPGSFVKMNGREVFKFAVSSIEKDIRLLCEQAGVSPEEVDLYLLHQANLRIIEAARERLNLPPERFPTNIQRYGNTSSATIPLLLDELARAGKIQNGQLLFFSAFGAGLATGSCLLRWEAYNKKEESA